MRSDRAVAGIGLVLLLAACGGGGGSSVAYTFNKAQPSCRVHQPKAPDATYTAAVSGLTSFTIDQAGFLQDFGPHAAQAFCDGGKATAEDTAWSALYTRLSASLPGSASLVLPSPDAGS